MTIDPFGWTDDQTPFVNAADLELMHAHAGGYTDEQVGLAITNHDVAIDPHGTRGFTANAVGSAQTALMAQLTTMMTMAASLQVTADQLQSEVNQFEAALASI